MAMSKPSKRATPPSKQGLMDRTALSKSASNTSLNGNAHFLSLLARLWKGSKSTKPVAEPTILPTTTQLLAKTSKSFVYLGAPKKPMRVIKISADASRLDKEYLRHAQIEADFVNAHDMFQQGGKTFELPYIPQCGEHFVKVLGPKGEKFGLGIEDVSTNASGYTMEYIRPLNSAHMKYLIKRYLAPSTQEHTIAKAANQPSIGKIYLGFIRPMSDWWNSDLRDRPCYGDQLIAEGIDIEVYAGAMGASLATLHWHSDVDANGIEFMLGCDNRGTVHMWLIDFADCDTFMKTTTSVRTQLVAAVVNNEPFWPRWIDLDGHREVWPKFRRAYLEASELILEMKSKDEWSHLPVLFMDELERVRGPPSSASHTT